MIWIDFMKTTFALLAGGLGYYYGSTIGFGVWSQLSVASGVLVLLSVFIERLHLLAVFVAVNTAIMATIMVTAILALGGVGGVYRIKEQTQTELYFLILLMVFGFSAFKWKLKKP